MARARSWMVPSCAINLETRRLRCPDRGFGHGASGGELGQLVCPDQAGEEALTAGALTVQASVSDRASGLLFSDPLPVPVEIPEEDPTKPFTMATMVDEADGTVTAMVSEDDAYDVAAPSSPFD